MLGVIFWAIGACITSFMGWHNTFILSAAAEDAPSAEEHHFWPWVALGAGAIMFCVFFGPFVFIPLASSEIKRIYALQDPHAGNFFHIWRLLALLICIPCLVVLNKHLEQFYVADLIFGGSVIPVSMGLWSGAFMLLRAWCLFERDGYSMASEEVKDDRKHSDNRYQFLDADARV